MENDHQAVIRLLQLHGRELSQRDQNAHKGTFGRLVILAGSRGMAGAAYLAGLAAFRCGIGMVRYLGPECNRVILQSLLPEAMYSSLEPDKGPEALAEQLAWGDYCIIGPGLSRSEEAEKTVRMLFDPAVRRGLSQMKLLLLDADALNIMAAEGLDPGALQSKATVITPHLVEMSRLNRIPVDEIRSGQEKIAAAYAREHKVHVVLKDAIPVGVFLHGAAGCRAALEKGSHSILARDIAEAAGEVLREIPQRYMDGQA